MKRLLITAIFLTTVINLSFSQTKDYSQDVATIDGIITALYEVISGEANEPRDWDRFRNLFKPESRLIPTGKGKDGSYNLRSISPEEYVQMFSNNIKTGFFEVELSHTLEEYGTIAHVFSTYETRETTNGPVANRGINSIQLFKDKDRYYVVSIFWCAESMGFPVPEKYLK